LHFAFLILHFLSVFAPFAPLRETFLHKQYPYYHKYYYRTIWQEREWHIILDAVDTAVVTPFFKINTAKRRSVTACHTSTCSNCRNAGRGLTCSHTM
jgi:hypothetical protein